MQQDYPGSPWNLFGCNNMLCLFITNKIQKNSQSATHAESIYDIYVCRYDVRTYMVLLAISIIIILKYNSLIYVYIVQLFIIDKYLKKTHTI